MRIRVIKHLPAPTTDGFAVRGLLPNHVYEVNARTGRFS